ncbi:MAG: N-acetyltransferase [Candidatus Diapherotrites archaeon]|nr:N-acetyltransferase [Candidatus Diapherotrites archaeon]
MPFILPSSIGSVQIRLLAHGDEKNLVQLANSLSADTRELFAPYKWGADAQIQDFKDAILSSEAGKDLSYLLFTPSGTPIGHMALWSVTQPHFLDGKNIKIPTLGICIANDFQRKGLGRIGVNFLQKQAREIGVNAIELTFAPRNYRAERLYQSQGFEDIGMLRIPLGVNPAAQNVDLKSVKVWRDERHFAYIIDHNNATAIKSYLKNKQTKKVQ